MRKNFLVIVILFYVCELFGQQSEIKNTDHSGVKEQSYFRLMGEIDLRQEPDFKKNPQYRTINLEGGMEVKVLEIGERSVMPRKNISGIWMHVLTVAPMWVESGEWIEKYNKFWIFLPDETQIFDLEE